MLSPNGFQVLIPLISLTVNVLIQIIIVRFIPRLGLLNSVCLGFIFGIISLLCFELYTLSGYPIVINKDFIIIFIVNMVVYASLGYSYFHFINLGETALRIKIIRELYDSEGLSMEEILQCYNANNIVNIRIGRLLKNGQIIVKNGRYYIGSPVMLLMAKAILIMKVIIFGKNKIANLKIKRN